MKQWNRNNQSLFPTRVCISATGIALQRIKNIYCSTRATERWAMTDSEQTKRLICIDIEETKSEAANNKWTTEELGMRQ